jgi:streptogramin lyase
MTRGLRAFVGVIGLLGAVGCLSPRTLPPCDGWDESAAFCGFRHPEDLGHLQSGDWILVSEMTRSDSTSEEDEVFRPGRLTAIRLPEDGGPIDRRKLFPAEFDEEPPPGDRWGDPACEWGPSLHDFQPHGIDIGPGPDGRTALAVVTHGQREVVDLFEVIPGPAPEIGWRGCVEMPEAVAANDVALYDEGSFVVTSFVPPAAMTGFRSFGTFMKLSFGGVTGSVYRWTPTDGLQEIPESQGSAPNGVAVTPDGRTLWVSEWGGRAVYRLDADEEGAIRRRRVEIDGRPDNLTRRADGGLLVAAQDAGVLRIVGCADIQTGGCDVRYTVTEIDPDSLATTLVSEGRGGASVALEVGDEIWIGFFAGDSIARTPLAD